MHVTGTAAKGLATLLAQLLAAGEAQAEAAHPLASSATPLAGCSPGLNGIDARWKNADRSSGPR